MKPRPHADDPIANPGFETLCAHFGEDPTSQFGAASVPIYQTSTFIYPDAEAFEARRAPDTPHYDYTRGGNPTAAVLEAKLARLERGAWAESFGSGMGAISAAINLAVRSEAHVVCVGNVYSPTSAYLRHLERFGVRTTFVRELDPQAFIDAITPATRLMYLESPTTGLFEILDVRAITPVCRERGILTIFDNSCVSSLFQSPLEMGCDLVVHSATKYIGGHSDVVAGVVVGRDERLRDRLFREIELCGATLDPFGAWLLIRGLRTLALRMRHHEQAALAVARMLAGHPAVRAVHHPGLESHPQHALARTQMSGFSSLFSFEPADQSREATLSFLNRLRLFRQGVSWGGHESLAIGGKLFGGPNPQSRVIRLHCGLESIPDLVADVAQALA
ncbi:MAG: PLP-dependent transferase [Phycisphaerales bacterium]|nr:PLP-dependent transferase [Phycisphaerales bacterium]